MSNIGLSRIKDADIDNFTSRYGMALRKKMIPIVRKLLKIFTKSDIIVLNYPKLQTDKSYIFVSTHSFVDEIAALLSSIDRSAYTLMGTPDQLLNNIKAYVNWITGIVFVDRDNDKSRKDSLKKMEILLNNKTSVLIFPEGGWNNTENELVTHLFSSPYILSKLTGCEVIPIATFENKKAKKIYLDFGEPLNLSLLDKENALKSLKDSMATMLWELIYKYGDHIKRSELGSDPRMDYMMERVNGYLETKWTENFSCEIVDYNSNINPKPSTVRKSLENVNINQYNARYMYDLLADIEDDCKYDIRNYIDKNWQSLIRKKQK